MTIYEYVTHPVSGVVHLFMQGSRGSNITMRTLCGRIIGYTWQWGDETNNGIATTCGSCKARRRPE